MSEQSDISTLFARDPLRLTKEDRTKTIEHFRSNREKYISGEKIQKAAAAPKQKSKGILPDLDLDIEL